MPAPTTLIDHRPIIPQDQPIGIPIYSTARSKPPKEFKSSQLEPNLVTPLNGTVGATARRRPEPTYPLPPRSQFALGSTNGAFRASGIGTNLRKTPQNFDVLSTSSGSPNGLIFGAADSQLAKNLTASSERFQSHFKSNTNILLGGESQYYPRVTDRADV